MTNLLGVADGDRSTRVPTVVSDLAKRLGADPREQRSIVELTQTGRMRRSLDVKTWLPFKAVQTISTRACAFDWRARFGPLGSILVQDALQDGEGKLLVKALGMISIARTKPSPALTRGELMRYLAELAWAPDAILTNRALRWRDVSANTLAVGAGSGDLACEVFWTLDSEGRIAGGFALDRPRSPTPPFLPTRWSWRYGDYRHHAERWLPFSGEVAWTIDGKEIVYWEGRVTSWHD